MAKARLKGIPVSPGIAIGPILLARDAHIYEKRAISENEIESEIAAIETASKQVIAELNETLANVPASLSEYREIIAAQIELASDRKILDGARARVKRGKICAAWALSDTIEELCLFFQNMADPYLCDRAQDIRLIGQCLGDSLGGFRNNLVQGPNDILAAHDLLPSDLAHIELQGLQGLVTVEGGATSHTAILARGLKVPAIIGVETLFQEASLASEVILDGLTGEVIFDPGPEELAFYKRKKQDYEDFEAEALNAASMPAITLDKKLIEVFANLENASQLDSLRDSGAEGIGLYRTEFAYMNDNMPDEEKLVAEYEAVVARLAPQQVIFRILDVGADKILPVQEALHEPNPALGLRGIRFCLYRKDILKAQLRSLMRAASKGNVALLVPMISNIGEVREIKKLIRKVEKELTEQGYAHAEKLPLGLMIETPAAVLISDGLARECDFFSIGTNDLLHYLIAIDRNNRHVAYLCDPLHPAFIRALKQVIDSAHKAGIPVSVCGELAADPYGIALLLGLKVDSLSAAPRFVPAIKHLVRHLATHTCEKLANFAMSEFNSLKTHNFLAETFARIPHLGASMQLPNLQLS